MTVQEHIQNIESGTLHPVYFLFGTETFYQGEILNALNRKLITPENREFNLESFEAKSSSPGEWIGAAGTLSFLGGTKLVVVRHLHEASLKDAEVQTLLGYLSDPAPDACLVITAAKVDRKRKLYKTLTAGKGAVSCEPPKESILPGWLQKRARAAGYTLDSDAARLMVDRVGPKPGLLAAELDKVLIYAGENRKVSAKDTAEVVGDVRMENVFELTEALKGKNTQQAIRLLHNQLEHGEDPLKVLGTIAWQFRFIWEVKHYQAKKIPPLKIAEAMGSRPFMVEKAMRYTGKFSPRELRQGFQNLARADRELKTTGNPPLGVLETLVLKLCLTRGG